MRWLIAIFLTITSVGSAFAAGGGHSRDVHIDLGNKTGLQNGARLFANYCQGCHSLSFMRYNRIAEDLDIDLDVLRENLMFNTDKTGALVESSLSTEDAVAWFGKAPPDLSLYARARGADHLFTYLTGFYREDTGKINNVALPGVSMPHVLWSLQGWQTLGPNDDHGLPTFDIDVPGKLSPAEYDKQMTDLTAFLVYVAEPAALVRKKVGVYVILYLALMCFVFYLLKREYWRDIH